MASSGRESCYRLTLVRCLHARASTPRASLLRFLPWWLLSAFWGWDWRGRGHCRLPQYTFALIAVWGDVRVSRLASAESVASVPCGGDPPGVGRVEFSEIARLDRHRVHHRLAASSLLWDLLRRIQASERIAIRLRSFWRGRFVSTLVFRAIVGYWRPGIVAVHRQRGRTFIEQLARRCSCEYARVDRII